MLDNCEKYGWCCAKVERNFCCCVHGFVGRHWCRGKCRGVRVMAGNEPVGWAKG